MKKGYWQDWTNVEAVLRRLMAAHHGLIPAGSVFKKEGLQGLLTTLTTCYGGLTGVRKRLGVAAKKRCPECGKILDIGQFRLRIKRLRQNRDGTQKKERFRDSVCKTCANNRILQYRNTWRGRCAELTRRAKERAARFHVPFNIDSDYLFELLEQNNFCCALSGVPLDGPQTPKVDGWRFTPRLASLDRIRPKVGYVKGNVRIIAVQLNFALGKFGEESLERLAIAFLRRRGYIVTSAVRPGAGVSQENQGNQDA